MSQDYSIIISVHRDSFGQRSVSVSTDPEGVPAEDVNGILKSLSCDDTDQ